MDDKNNNSLLNDESVTAILEPEQSILRKPVSKPRASVASYLAKIGMLSAISVMLMYLQFPIFPLFPFLELDFADVSALIGGFVLGPLASVCIVVIKIALTILFKGTLTVGIGELSLLIVSLSFTLPPALLYKYKKGLKWVILGLIIGIIWGTTIACLSNNFLIFPMYQSLPNVGFLDADKIATVVLTVVLPFNLIKLTSVSIITLVVYKQVAKVLKRF